MEKVILTYKLKHNRDFSEELNKAFKIAIFAIKNRDKLTTKYVKHIGLKSIIANQILRKYGRDKKCKTVKHVNLIIPYQGIKYTQDTIYIPCLKFALNYKFPKPILKINQIEISKDYMYIAVTVPALNLYEPKTVLGVDRNTTGHAIVAACPDNGKVLKFGKQCQHIRNKYKNIRAYFQKKRKYKVLKRIKRREHNKIKYLNHLMSKSLVKYAYQHNAIIVLEDLKTIRKNKKHHKNFNHSLHSWSYYQFEQILTYKARLLGVPIVKIDPHYTSQQCSKCGHLGNRNGKQFKCPFCGHVENADVNAAFVIALRHKGILQSPVDRDAGDGSTDTPTELQPRKAG